MSNLPCFFLKESDKKKIPVQTILLEITGEGKIILEPETILEIRVKKLRNREIKKYLMKRKNLPVEEATCEDVFFIQKQM
jgi:hypothetical protein